MNKKELLNTLYSAISDSEKNDLDPEGLSNRFWQYVENHIRTAYPIDRTAPEEEQTKQRETFDRVWGEFTQLVKDYAENAFVVGFNTALEITRH